MMSCTPTLEEAEREAAEAYCDQAVTCGWYDGASWDTCVAGEVELIDLAWPDNTCEEINERGLKRCLRAIGKLDCEVELPYFGTLGPDCAADSVCD